VTTSRPDSQRRTHGALLPWLLAGLATIGPFAIDTYLPSFPSIGRDYAVDELYVQQTLSVYMASFAVMTLFHGALSDSFGRRLVILVNLLVFVLASIGCALAPTIDTMLACRALQGMSAGAGIVVGRAIIRDTYDGPMAQRLMSQVTMLFSLAPAVAPVIGGLLDLAFGWRSIFAFLAVLSLLLWAGCAWTLPETLARADRQPFRAAPLFANYVQVFGSARFAMLAFAVAFNFAGFFI
jgi:DHA1 family bicyclomycin/chloramphenicol resistance-like MFS transporter